MSAVGEKKHRYHMRVKEDTVDAHSDLASDLGFFVSTPGRYYGDPSNGDLADALAAAYRANPTAVAAALRGLGIVGEGKPPER